MREDLCYVYILASERNGTIYIGVTSNIFKRINQHRTNYYPNSFTSKYKITKLVYFEIYGSIRAAIAREHKLKNWKRIWKLKLIEEVNPNWNDLYEDILKEYS
jgi:putative endonuclease